MELKLHMGRTVSLGDGFLVEGGRKQTSLRERIQANGEMLKYE